MTSTTQHPYIVQAFRRYATFPARLLIYAVVFVLATALALFLDVQIGLHPTWVLIITLGVISLLLVTVPLVGVGARKELNIGVTLTSLIDGAISDVAKRVVHDTLPIPGSGSGLGLSVARDIAPHCEESRVPDAIPNDPLISAHRAAGNVEDLQSEADHIRRKLGAGVHEVELKQVLRHRRRVRLLIVRSRRLRRLMRDLDVKNNNVVLAQRMFDTLLEAERSAEEIRSDPSIAGTEFEAGFERGFDELYMRCYDMLYFELLNLRHSYEETEERTGPSLERSEQ